MTWLWIENEAYAGQTPRKLTGACHDGSAFITIRCGCNAEQHIHESQLADVPRLSGVAMLCKNCGDILQFNHNELPSYFADLRKRGWID